MYNIKINLQSEYNIYIDSALLNSQLLIDSCRAQANRFAIITDDKIDTLYGVQLLQLMREHGLDAELIIIPHGEQHKTRETKAWIEDQLLEKGFTRDSCLIALGGGVITDIGGFVASTYCRGVPVIYIPTSLLAMVDASVGGKTGVNTDYGKNLIGTFTQPAAVFMDVDTLETLSQREINAGLVEMIKHSLLDSPQAFESILINQAKIQQLDKQCLAELIYHSCLIKRGIVIEDEKEQGKRQLLNLGHTIAHALETVSYYQLTHGEAVAIGIVAEAEMAVAMDILPVSALNKIKNLFKQFDISYQLKNYQLDLQREEIQQALLLDKKNKKKIPYFVLLREIGKYHQTDQDYSMPVDSGILDAAINRLIS